MSKSNPTPSQPSGGDASASADVPAAAPDLEENVQLFWEKNRTLLIGIAVLVLVAIVGRNGWIMLQESQEEAARMEYAALDSDSAREAFADSHAGTTLAGAALLEVADAAFADGRFGEAKTKYQAAAEELEGTVFADRVSLGVAMSTLMSGDESAAITALRDLANNPAVSPAVRSEAIFHLASRAANSGDFEALNSLVTQIVAIDPASNWTRRVTMLQAAVGSAPDDTEESTITVPSL
ncbi:tetratricopeptide repeat protein [Actomonas aquatica]|uniref:Tetratricopeptide repeat protein n=1 Tax=Actomonas aquatica TaxID=2866162 RepID=A0ABZ1CGP5_9BACT|nr:tetratricopeptide repeat protein [Opitutus sp. WL0086]WRQ89754.1 tetratricopeptide repeat protein [Opitutus sp. WL0086]